MRFFFGLLTGVVAGMLLAPDNGKSTREKLNKNLPKYKAKANEALDMTKNAYNDIASNLGLTKEHLPQEKELMQSNGSAKTSNSNNTGNSRK